MRTFLCKDDGVVAALDEDAAGYGTVLLVGRKVGLPQGLVVQYYMISNGYWVGSGKFTARIVFEWMLQRYSDPPAFIMPEDRGGK